MTIFDLLTMLGGLSLFLFGMHIMGNALERKAGSRLKLLLSRLTKNRFAAFLTGLAVTAVIQSSSATTVMVVGFVNSGILTLRQSIGVIMGANIGTTVTAWILSLSGISGDNIFIRLLKPSAFTPVLSVIGIIFLLGSKKGNKKDTGMILLGFSTLMFGMQTMSDAVSGLADIPAFGEMFLLFKNPVLGVAAGAVLTALIQSSSASVGVLQALSVTGRVSYGAAIPIIMGQNIGTCITAVISSFGANKNAKRAAVIHLSFNIIGTAVWLAVFSALSTAFKPAFLDTPASFLGIALAHTIFNILCTVILFPAAGVLEKLALKLVPGTDTKESVTVIDERLLASPSLALERCNELVFSMAEKATESFSLAVNALFEPSKARVQKISELEELTDRYEDIIGTYLIKLSRNRVSDNDSAVVSELLKTIGDYERIADHSVNILESAQELLQKNIEFTQHAKKELDTLCRASIEITDLAYTAFVKKDINSALSVEPLEQVIDELKQDLRSSHILRLKNGDCSAEAGFIWADLLTDLERVADHCSNIAACVIDTASNNMDIHRSVKEIKNSPSFKIMYESYAEKYIGTQN